MVVLFSLFVRVLYFVVTNNWRGTKNIYLLCFLHYPLAEANGNCFSTQAGSLSYTKCNFRVGRAYYSGLLKTLRLSKTRLSFWRGRVEASCLHKSSRLATLFNCRHHNCRHLQVTERRGIIRWALAQFIIAIRLKR